MDTALPGGRARPAWRRWLAPASILVLAAALRLPAIGRDGMWSDECLTATWAELPWRDTLAAAASDNNAPLYFLLEKLPVALLGSSELAWRLLPALLGLLTVWAIYAAGRRLLSPAAGWIAAFLLATSPLHVHYSREARNYTLLILLVLLAFMAAARVRSRGRAADVALLAALLAAALYTHPTAAFAALGVLVAWSVFPFDRKAAGRLAIAALLAGAALAPWVPRLLHQGGRAGESYSWHQPGFEREFPWQVPRSLAALSHGSLAPIRNRVPDLLPSAWAAAGLTVLLAGLAVARRRALAQEALPLRLLVAALLPLVALFAAASLGPPVYVVGRTDAFVLPLLLLLVAAGVAGYRSAAVRALAVVAFAGLALLPMRVLLQVDTRSQEKLIARLLSGERRPGEPVVATAMLPCLQFYAGLTRGMDLIAYPERPAVTTSWVDWPAHPTERWPAEAADVAARAREWANRDRATRLWVVRSRDPLGETLARAFDRTCPLLGARDLHYLGLELRAYHLSGVPQPDQ
ncbi:MAG: glycosyltransferase family 39 protein [Acidobacteriia bacterium]|nr:glycosyltransferase family 39 protein [Terriglobia bacterium]